MGPRVIVLQEMEGMCQHLSTPQVKQPAYVRNIIKNWVVGTWYCSNDLGHKKAN